MVKRTIARIVMLMAVLFWVMSTVVFAGAVSQGFKAKDALPTGASVSLSKGSSDSVEKATLDNEQLMVGVIASGSGALIDLQPAGSEVRVAVSGDTTLLVTTLNGDIKSGDQLVISPLAGVSMKFSETLSNKKIVATSSEAFDKATPSAKEIEVTKNNGQKQKVFIGRINAKLLLSDRVYDNVQKRNFLTSLSEKVAGKQVSPLKLIASTVISVSTFVLAGLILNGSVKGSFISLGRNPLSKDSIVNGLVKSSLLAVVIVAMGLGMAYAILVL